LVGTSTFLMPTKVAAAGGPVILDGTDSGYHGQVDGSGVVSGQWLYTQKAYENLIAGVSSSYLASSNGRIAVVGAPESGSTTKPLSNNCGAAAYWSAQGLSPSVAVDFYDGAAAIGAFFDGVRAGTIKPLLIHLVDTVCNTNQMDAAELTKVNERANDIAIHVNRGGALLSNTGAFSGATNYGWLTVLFPDLSAPTSCSGSSLSLTAAGQEAFPSLTNSDIAGAWHNCFTSTSATFPLDVLATQNGHYVIIGGASVTLPSSVTASASAASLETGQEVCIEVNVTSGNPATAVSGASVSFSIAGANSSATLGTQTTDSSGDTASACYTGTTTGTDTITASAIDPSNSNPLGEATVTVVWTAPTTVAPSAPSSPAAVAGNSQATITWEAPSSDGGATITGYTVTASPGGRTCTWTSGPLTCTVTGLTNGTEYTFIVTATNSAGTGGSSDGVIATPRTVPGAPGSVGFSRGNSQATITWEAPSSDGGATITGYTVTASPGGRTCTWTSGPLTCTVTGLTNGTEYTFIVTASNVVGTSDPSVTKSGTPLGLPGAPTSLAAVVGNRSITLNWTAPSDNGGSEIIDYVVEYQLDGGSWTLLDDGVSVAASTTISGLTNGITYDFRIAAVNGVGTGPSTGLESPVTMAPIPIRQTATEDLPRLAPGTFSLLEDDQEVPLTVEVTEGQNGLRLSDGAGFSMELAVGNGPSYSVVDRQVLTVAPSGMVDVQGEGFSPGSEVDVWVFSDPTYLGFLVVAEDGTFSGSLALPIDIPAGEHTVQANGISRTGALRSLNAGIMVEEIALPATGQSTSMVVDLALIVAASGLLFMMMAPRRRRLVR
jgi:hypothetical protein